MLKYDESDHALVQHPDLSAKDKAKASENAFRKRLKRLAKRIGIDREGKRLIPIIPVVLIDRGFKRHWVELMHQKLQIDVYSSFTAVIPTSYL